MPPAPEGRRRPFGDDAASRGALQPRQIFKAHRDAAGSTREQDLEAGGGAGSAPGDQLRDLRICKISLSRPCLTQNQKRTVINQEKARVLRIQRLVIRDRSQQMGVVGAVEAADRTVAAGATGAMDMTVMLLTRRRRSRMVARQEAKLAGSRGVAKLAARRALASVRVTARVSQSQRQRRRPSSATDVARWAITCPNAPSRSS